LVKLEATGISHFDTFLMSGAILKFGGSFPFIPGSDAVGRVIKTGKGAETFLNKRVVGLSGNTWA